MTFPAAFRALPPALIKRLTGLPAVDLRAVSALSARLSSRERLFVGAAGVTVAGVLAYLLLIDPLWEAHTRLRARVAAKERELGEIATLRRTYQALRADIERARTATGEKFTPVAFLEGLAASTVGRDKVTAINPVGHETRDGASQETIELTLSGVSLRELVGLLYKIDTAGATLRTLRLSLKKRYKDPYTFDVSLTTFALSAH